MSNKWRTGIEAQYIKKHGGTPGRVQDLGDGVKLGRPMEVKAARQDPRYRINRDNHKAMVRKKGSYIFVNEKGESKKVPAKKVSKLIGAGKWLKDRSYPHKFLKVAEIFK